jgi:hypothetical protein
MLNHPELPIGDRALEVCRSVMVIPLDKTRKFNYSNQLRVFKWRKDTGVGRHQPQPSPSIGSFRPAPSQVPV